MINFSLCKNIFIYILLFGGSVWLSYPIKYNSNIVIFLIWMIIIFHLYIVFKEGWDYISFIGVFVSSLVLFFGTPVWLFVIYKDVLIEKLIENALSIQNLFFIIIYFLIFSMLFFLGKYKKRRKEVEY